MTAAALMPLLPDFQAVMNHHAKSFSWAARFLSTAARRDAALLYAFARTADDLADEADLGPQQERIAALRELLEQSLRPVSNSSSLGNQAGTMLRRYGVPDTVLKTFMDSLQADVDARHIDTTENLLLFAYGVAGTVGQMMRPLLGAPTTANAPAIALGVAMQLTNIARDVVEDAHRGRCYIPCEWGVSAASMSAPQSDHEKTLAFAAIQRLLSLSDDFYAFARASISGIPRHNRRAIRIAAALYQGIGRKILRQGPRLYWQGRAYLTPLEKTGILSKTLLLPDTPFRTKAVRDVWQNDLKHLAGVPGFPNERLS